MTFKINSTLTYHQGRHFQTRLLKQTRCPHFNENVLNDIHLLITGDSFGYR